MQRYCIGISLENKIVYHGHAEKYNEFTRTGLYLTKYEINHQDIGITIYDYHELLDHYKEKYPDFKYKVL